MKIRSATLCILYGIATISILLASGVNEAIDWQEIARPYFIVWAISITIAIFISNIDNIRRFTYPLFVCFCAWAYKHKLIMNKFTRNTYRLYKYKNNSYKHLFQYVQNLFDAYLDALDY